MNRRLLASAGKPIPVSRLHTLLGYVSNGFTKSADNPILPKGTAGAWDDWGVRELSPVIDEDGLLVTESDGIWGYYGGRPDGSTGAFQIGLAKSTDNGATWTRYASNPVIAPAGTGWYQNWVFQPTVVKLASGTRVMLAAGRPGSGSVHSIGCLTSTDGLSWTDAGQKLTVSDFDASGVGLSQLGVPNMIRRSAGDWVVLVEGFTREATPRWHVFGATATDPTGTWTVLNSGQPLLSGTGSGWESLSIANAHIIEASPGRFLMLYNGMAEDGFWQLGFAHSSDLLSWTRHPDNPVLTIGAGQWDDTDVESDFILKEPDAGQLRIYYHGGPPSTGEQQVGLATSS